MAYYDPKSGQWKYDEEPRGVRGLASRAGLPVGPLPPSPTLTDELVIQRQLQRKQQLASLRGRSSTFLTGPRGVGLGLPTSEMATAFLMARIDDEPDVAAPAPEAPASPSAPGIAGKADRVGRGGMWWTMGGGG